jgi:hypothetical protein
MNRSSACIGFALASIIAMGGTLILASGGGVWRGSPALAATSQQKAEARKDLDQVISALRAVDTSYASGNAAEAQTRFDEARATWNRVAPAISAREAREAQLMFDGLAAKLKSAAPPADVKSTVSGMLEELREDIAEELR